MEVSTNGNKWKDVAQLRERVRNEGVVREESRGMDSIGSQSLVVKNGKGGKLTPDRERKIRVD